MHRVTSQVESRVGYTDGNPFSAEVRRRDRDRPSRNLTLFYLGNEGTLDRLKIGRRLSEHGHVTERLRFEPFVNGLGKGTCVLLGGPMNCYNFFFTLLGSPSGSAHQAMTGPNIRTTATAKLRADTFAVAFAPIARNLKWLFRDIVCKSAIVAD